MQSLLNMVRLVQLVEHQIVVLGVVGSSPTSHPLEDSIFTLSSFFIHTPPYFALGGGLKIKYYF